VATGKLVSAILAGGACALQFAPNLALSATSTSSITVSVTVAVGCRTLTGSGALLMNCSLPVPYQVLIDGSSPAGTATTETTGADAYIVPVHALSLDRDTLQRWTTLSTEYPSGSEFGGLGALPGSLAAKPDMGRQCSADDAGSKAYVVTIIY
jgi:hypothetical protein